MAKPCWSCILSSHIYIILLFSPLQLSFYLCNFSLPCPLPPQSHGMSALQGTILSPQCAQLISAQHHHLMDAFPDQIKPTLQALTVIHTSSQHMSQLQFYISRMFLINVGIFQWTQTLLRQETCLLSLSFVSLVPNQVPSSQYVLRNYLRMGGWLNLHIICLRSREKIPEAWGSQGKQKHNRLLGIPPLLPQLCPWANHILSVSSSPNWEQHLLCFSDKGIL